MKLPVNDRVRRKAVWGAKALGLAFAMVLAGVVANVDAAPKHHLRQGAKAQPGVPSARVKQYKLDDELTRRANKGNALNTTPVIVTLVPGAQLPSEFKKFSRAGKLDIINGQVLDLPDRVLRQLAAHPDVFRVHYDRPIKSHNYRTAVTVGARDVVAKYGYTGAGIGIAVIDSGITSWHDDLVNYTSKTFPYGNQRVAKFVDFVNGRTLPYDDNGHGTHVSGIIGGVGYDSKYYEKAGIAPLASLVSLKVLDQNGQGSVSNLIAALNWVALNYKTYNIRVVNMSVGAAVRESYWTDPLTLAARAVTDKGITVVTAAGNIGKNRSGQLQYGGITAPGNAPWVLTVGASSTMGTTNREDDTMGDYSSSGPTAFDFAAKPDLVAPGTGTVSLAAVGSLFYATKAQYLVKGNNGLPAYLTLTGTSMAAPVVSGTVALMLQANPNLTPNLIKAILQYTAQEYPGYNALRQGAGFLNTLGAVDLARFYATAAPGARMPVQKVWSKKINWGSHQLKHGVIKPTANAWANTVVWGSAKTGGATGQNIVWGVTTADDMNIVWGVNDLLNIVWGVNDALNIVWGTLGDDLNIVWGTGDDLNIVWGTDCGGADCANIMWGTSDDQNIVWGVAEPDANIMWGTSFDDLNIVWGTSGDADVTWGNDAGGDAVVFPDDESEPLPSVQLEFGDVLLSPVEGINPTTGGL
jgi:serine protease AprX